MTVHQFEPVPPPKQAPIDELGASLGLIRGLRAEHDRRSFRCAECERLQPSGSVIVWVPDGLRLGDPADVIEDVARESAYNGHGGGWCLSCAQRLSRPSLAPQKGNYVFFPTIVLVAALALTAVALFAMLAA